MFLCKRGVGFSGRYFCRYFQRFLSHESASAHTISPQNLKQIKAITKQFYKLVHPDRFQSFPQEKKINEENLKKLTNLIQTFYPNDTENAVISHSPTESCELIFYIYTASADTNEKTLKKINSEFKNIYHGSQQNQFKKTLENLFKEANLIATAMPGSDQENLENLFEYSSPDIEIHDFLRKYSLFFSENPIRFTQPFFIIFNFLN